MLPPGQQFPVGRPRKGANQRSQSQLSAPTLAARSNVSRISLKIRNRPTNRACRLSTTLTEQETRSRNDRESCTAISQQTCQAALGTLLARKQSGWNQKS